MNLKIIYIPVIMLLSFGCHSQDKASKEDSKISYQIEKSDEEWKKELTSEEYYVLREKGTERAFTGDLNNNKEKGIYTCAACANELFSSSTKYESHSGWPSFYKPISNENVLVKKDYSQGMVRDEVICKNCGGHLGHVFEDGPEPTGLRYCVNSVAMDFKIQE